MGVVFNKTLPRPRWLDPEHERCDRSYQRACWEAQPSWANVRLMRAMFARARRHGLEVDHIVPLRHPHVCGLHTHTNLRLVRRQENAAKSNRHWPNMFHEQIPLINDEPAPHQLHLTGVPRWDTA